MSKAHEKQPIDFVICEKQNRCKSKIGWGVAIGILAMVIAGARCWNLDDLKTY